MKVLCGSFLEDNTYVIMGVPRIEETSGHFKV